MDDLHGAPIGRFLCTVLQALGRLSGQNCHEFHELTLIFGLEFVKIRVIRGRNPQQHLTGALPTLPLHLT